MKLKRSPIHLTRQSSVNSKAWFYENAGSIDVYIVPKEGGPSVRCRIQRALLADWIERTRSAA